MPDDFKDSTENKPEASAGTMLEKLNPTGITAMQGNDTFDQKDIPQQDQHQDKDSQDLITARHHHPEKLPNVETPGQTIPASEGNIQGREGGPPDPPKDWRPGGPERGG